MPLSHMYFLGLVQMDAAITHVFSWLGSKASQKDSCGSAVDLC